MQVKTGALLPPNCTTDKMRDGNKDYECGWRRCKVIQHLSNAGPRDLSTRWLLVKMHCNEVCALLLPSLYPAAVALQLAYSSCSQLLLGMQVLYLRRHSVRTMTAQLLCLGVPSTSGGTKACTQSPKT